MVSSQAALLMGYAAPVKMCFTNRHALNHQGRTAVTLWQISVALPAASEWTPASASKQSYFTPRCAQLESVHLQFPIIWRVEVESKGNIGKWVKYTWNVHGSTLPFSWRMPPLYSLPCLGVWWNDLLMTFDCSHREGQARAGRSSMEQSCGSRQPGLLQQGNDLQMKYMWVFQDVHSVCSICMCIASFLQALHWQQ